MRWGVESRDGKSLSRSFGVKFTPHMVKKKVFHVSTIRFKSLAR